MLAVQRLVQCGGEVSLAPRPSNYSGWPTCSSTCTGTASEASTAHETAEGLRGAGLLVEQLPAPVAYADMPAAVARGEALLIQGIGHACVLGRTDDGRLYLYDSEGIGGERRAPCLVVLQPGSEAPELLARYGRFEASHRVRRPHARDVMTRRVGTAVP